MGAVMCGRCDGCHARSGVVELLKKYPDLAIRPAGVGPLRIAGALEFHAVGGGAEVRDVFHVEMEVPHDFPKSPPLVRETGGRIPPTFHTNPDGSLCLGSPLQLRMVLHDHPTILGFVDAAVVPYFFAFVIWQKTGRFPFGELAHGDWGLLEEYCALLGVSERRVCVALIELLGVKKRIANKLPCPCGSSKRVGRCHHRALNRLRSFASRSWFRREAARLRLLPEQRRPDVTS